MANILVANGVGFIGNNLIKELRLWGHIIWTSLILHEYALQHFKIDLGFDQQDDASSGLFRSITNIISPQNTAAGTAKITTITCGEQTHGE